MKKAMLIAAGAAVLAIAACKKGDNGKAVTTSELITASTWAYDTITLDLNKDGVADSELPNGFVQTCDLDNTITFKSDGTGVSDEGPTKCADSLPQSSPFTWALTSKDTLTITGYPQIYLNGPIAIRQLTNTSLVLLKEVNFLYPFALNANVIVTLKKKS